MFQLSSIDLVDYNKQVTDINAVSEMSKVYSLHWQQNRLNRTIRLVWLKTNSLMYISKTSHESITIYESVTN